MAKGTLRVGLRVSSPAAAAPSNPAVDRIANVSASPSAPVETPLRLNSEKSTVCPCGPPVVTSAAKVRMTVTKMSVIVRPSMPRSR